MNHPALLRAAEKEHKGYGFQIFIFFFLILALQNHKRQKATQVKLKSLYLIFLGSKKKG